MSLADLARLQAANALRSPASPPPRVVERGPFVPTCGARAPSVDLRSYPTASTDLVVNRNPTTYVDAGVLLPFGRELP